MFFTIFFFNIYILEKVTSDLVLIFAYYLIGIVAALLLYYPFFKMLKQKTVVWIYRSSFIFSFIIIVLSMTINSSLIFSLIFINFLRYVYNMFFYIPHEICSILNTTKSSVNKFLAVQSVLNVSVTIVANVLVGYLFETVNILWLLGVMLIDVVVMFCLSLGIKTIPIHNNFQPKLFAEQIKEQPKVKFIYVSHFFKRMSEAGVVFTLIPIMLYLKLGSSFSIGIYASLSSILAVSLLPIFVKHIKNKHLVLILLDILLIALSVLLIVFTNPIVYIIYYFIHKIVSSFFSNAEISSLFSCVQKKGMSQFVSEHVYIYGIVGLVSEILSYLIGIVVCVLLPLEYSIPVIICVFMLAKFIAILFMIKSNKTKDKRIEIENKESAN